MEHWLDHRDTGIPTPELLTISSLSFFPRPPRVLLLLFWNARKCHWNVSSIFCHSHSGIASKINGTKYWKGVHGGGTGRPDGESLGMTKNVPPFAPRDPRNGSSRSLARSHPGSRETNNVGWLQVEHGTWNTDCAIRPLRELPIQRIHFRSRGARWDDIFPKHYSHQAGSPRLSFIRPAQSSFGQNKRRFGGKNGL